MNTLKLFNLGKIILLLLFSVFGSASAYASDLPIWVERSCKVVSFEKMSEWLEGEVYYNIFNIEAIEKSISSGQLSSEVTISFDDNSGCQNRRVISTCVPVGLGSENPAVSIFTTISNCLPDSNKQIFTRVSKI